jgi:hypothetical protein
MLLLNHTKKIIALSSGVLGKKSFITIALLSKLTLFSSHMGAHSSALHLMESL